MSVSGGFKIMHFCFAFFFFMAVSTWGFDQELSPSLGRCYSIILNYSPEQLGRAVQTLLATSDEIETIEMLKEVGSILTYSTGMFKPTVISEGLLTHKQYHPVD